MNYSQGYHDAARILKHLVAMGAIEEAGADEYCPNGFARVLTVERYSDALPLMTRRFTKGILALPEFLKKNNYRNPTSATDTAFQLGHSLELNFFG
ncbi:hypothetical protein N7474_007756 [Penicillium riverlandense]|uniref:uncharacterized protein n=1 Tax=Penicillium riverlandense TaxID=1903569 RepID=UPI0025487F06|nr:uncharacterized protein N7474_007756 [Penicillium riverlandense]KAJ5811455.1 hypothetical protein N7474_007756 [Penicillium riverlandense]